MSNKVTSPEPQNRESDGFRIIGFRRTKSHCKQTVLLKTLAGYVLNDFWAFWGRGGYLAHIHPPPCGRQPPPAPARSRFNCARRLRTRSPSSPPMPWRCSSHTNEQSSTSPRNASWTKAHVSPCIKEDGLVCGISSLQPTKKWLQLAACAWRSFVFQAARLPAPGSPRSENPDLNRHRTRPGFRFDSFPLNTTRSLRML